AGALGVTPTTTIFWYVWFAAVGSDHEVVSLVGAAHDASTRREAAVRGRRTAVLGFMDFSLLKSRVSGGVGARFLLQGAAIHGSIERPPWLGMKVCAGDIGPLRGRNQPVSIRHVTPGERLR